MLTPFYQATSGSLRIRLICSHAVHDLSALMHHFMSSVYVNTRIHTTSMLATLSYAPLELLVIRVLAGFSVDVNPCAQIKAGLLNNAIDTQRMGLKNPVYKTTNINVKQ